jgi:CheY-like chemotaxis protein
MENDLLAALKRVDVDGDDHRDEESPDDVLTDEQSDGRDEEPVDAQADGQSDGRVSADGNGHAASRERSVLIIDDQPDLLELVGDGLQEDEALTVSVAQGGRAGLEAIQKEKPDVIVLSLTMPEVDGFQILASLSEDPATSHIPVLLLTAKNLSPEDYGRLTEQAVSMVSKTDRSPEDLLRSITLALAGME